MKYKCPYCGFYTFEHRPNGTYDICKVCFWEDDPTQLGDCNYKGGANGVSLLQAKANFLRFSACEERMIPYVREPKEDEMKGFD